MVADYPSKLEVSVRVRDSALSGIVDAEVNVSEHSDSCIVAGRFRLTQPPILGL